MIKEKLTKVKCLSKLKKVILIILVVLIISLGINVRKEIRRNNDLAKNFTYNVYVLTHNLRESINDWENEDIKILTYLFENYLEDLENKIYYANIYKNKWGYDLNFYSIRELYSVKIISDDETDGSKIISKQDKEYEDVKYLIEVLENILKELEIYIDPRGGSTNKSFKKVFEIIEKYSRGTFRYSIGI